MFSSWLPSLRSRPRSSSMSTASSDASTSRPRRPRQDVSEYDSHEGHSDEDGEDEEEATPLLPIFSAAHLDSLPVYNLTHAIRDSIVKRCETTLSWEQLRTPQISQFVVKPIQQEIRSTHFNRAVLYALLANCLQFNKEGEMNPGMVGVSRTRALVAELLATRLLREFSTRELIDALSYDFDPLQGMPSSPLDHVRPRLNKIPSYERQIHSRAARTSTLEVAIRAQAKRFLAHPLVVQHLEAIWAGTIVFHSAADSLHRYPTRPSANRARQYGAIGSATSQGDVAGRANQASLRLVGEPIRRSVTLYNPSNASLFKLSRLRVPRYRQIFSTMSYTVMIGLFLAVLIQRSRDITSLEVLFWLWGAGFMLDEIVGFTEQGFGLYIMSVWNAFDLGILMLFFSYYILRLYGIAIAVDDRHRIAETAYDILATSSILLFPRICSFLDHYKYFSQLLIAFRLMAQDLVAILVLIAIACSGFFVAFTLSFGDRDFTGGEVAYILFQILMGFTPAAWDIWSNYNALGKALLALFLIICHFLVVTILITVLTNSFMAIVKNANEEHQFLFAVNTISMVKSDALFSYIAPLNIVGWLFSPLRYCIPFRLYVRINRTIIKATHFPVLFLVFTYEKLRLARLAHEPVELIERRGRARQATPRFKFLGFPDSFNTGGRVRDASVASYRKDQALDELFRRPFHGDSTTNVKSGRSDRGGNNVDSWMSGLGNDPMSPPLEQPRSILEQLETSRPTLRRSMTSQSYFKRRGVSPLNQSIKSDIEDGTARFRRQRVSRVQEELERDFQEISSGQQAQTEDGDDELLTNDEDEREIESSRRIAESTENLASIEEDENTPTNPTFRGPKWGNSHENTQPPSSALFEPSPASPGLLSRSMTKPQRGLHNRVSSTNTILFKPVIVQPEASPPRRSPKAAHKLTRPSTSKGSPKVPSTSHTPQRGLASRPRPILPARSAFQSAPNISNMLKQSGRQHRREPSFDAIALDLASDIGDNRLNIQPDVNLLSASFQTQMFNAQAKKMLEQDESNRMSRIVLARMNNLEEGFRDILKEVKEWRHTGSRGTSTNDETSNAGSKRALRKTDKRPRRTTQQSRFAPQTTSDNAASSASASQARNTQATNPADDSESTSPSRTTPQKVASSL